MNIQQESPLPDIILPKKTAHIPSRPNILQATSKNSENIRKNSVKSLIPDSSSSEVTSSPIFVASTPKKSVQKMTKQEKGKRITIKITQKPLRVSSRLKIKLDEKLQEDTRPLPRWSERNLNSSIEYVEEYPEDDSDSDMVTAPSVNDVTEDTSPDKNKKKTENTLNEEDNENDKGVDRKEDGEKNIQRDADRKLITPEMSKEIVTRSKAKTNQNSVAANVKEKLKNPVVNVSKTYDDKEKSGNAEKEKGPSQMINVHPTEANEERNGQVKKEKAQIKVRNVCSKDDEDKNISDVPKKKGRNEVKNVSITETEKDKNADVQKKKEIDKSIEMSPSVIPSQAIIKRKKHVEAVQKSEGSSKSGADTEISDKRLNKKQEKCDVTTSRKRSIPKKSTVIRNEKEPSHDDESSKSTKKMKPSNVPSKLNMKGKGKKKNNEEEKDDSKDYMPKKHKSKDSDDTKVPKKKPKNNMDIHEYITRSIDKNTSEGVKMKDGSSASKSSSSQKNIDGSEERVCSENAAEEVGFNCPFCKRKFSNYVNFKAHKIICGSKGKKVSCAKCGKGFNTKSLMEQHYDYMHTNKPKHFICKIHNKAFELKKTLDEHNMRLHNTASYKFQCDICGHEFFHRNEFTSHRVQHSNIRPLLCGQCKDHAFSTEGKLKAHLAICGQPSKFECTICGKF